MDSQPLCSRPCVADHERANYGHNNKKDGYRALRDDAKVMLYAYVLLMEKELPTPEGEDLDWISLFRKAYYYWQQMDLDLSEHWSLYQDKYWFLDDKEKTD